MFALLISYPSSSSSGGGSLSSSCLANNVRQEFVSCTHHTDDILSRTSYLFHLMIPIIYSVYFFMISIFSHHRTCSHPSKLAAEHCVKQYQAHYQRDNKHYYSNPKVKEKIDTALKILIGIVLGYTCIVFGERDTVSNISKRPCDVSKRQEVPGPTSRPP
eukprot:TRINITY_DN12703_c0_g1_i1.p1 TRINITY_DN12703_c0_g1~~TRINITY_DN12703_c0_g1_i1.p1  ORF type:complete len:160 (-),score=11.05 TRINITY_DN12703_c0_g1_i1:787-1266(-)